MPFFCLWLAPVLKNKRITTESLPKAQNPMFEITPEIEEHFDSSLRIKAEATVEAIALSKSIQIGEPDQQIELAKASGWGTLSLSDSSFDKSDRELAKLIILKQLN